MAIGFVFLQWAGIVFLVSLSALFSGLTLGLMSLDITGLEIVIASGTPKESEYARKIYPIRSRGNLLLCTLLVGNVSVNSLLSILMADFTTGFVGFILSTTIIVILGEIFPQATCSRHGLAVGAHTVYIVYFFLVLFFPFTYPISFCLDLALGREVGTIYSKNELKKLLDIHAFHHESGVSRRDAVILAGVLDFAQKHLEQIMTPLDKVFMLDIEQRLDYNTLTSIMDNGHSRVPVYEGERNNIVSCLYMKDLALVNPEEGITLRSFLSFYGRQIPKIRGDKTLDFVLTEFKSGKSHMAIVQHNSGTNSIADNVGIATLEDILEEILQDEIMDEDDVGSPRSTNKGFRDVVLKGSSQINPHQMKAIYTFLSSSLPEFSPTLLSEDSFKYLLSKAETKHIDKPTRDEEPLYVRGAHSPYFTLVLQGKVEIQSGFEGFRSECGPFSYLGVYALKTDNFVPDFTAKVLVNAQLLRFRKKQYDDAIRMNNTITPARRLVPVGRLQPPEPKSFMDSNEFVERSAKRKGKHTTLAIALKDLTKKNTSANPEERMGLIAMAAPAAEGQEGEGETGADVRDLRQGKIDEGEALLDTSGSFASYMKSADAVISAFDEANVAPSLV